jgi:hypothetical protein
MSHHKSLEKQVGQEIAHVESHVDGIQSKDAIQDAASKGQALTGYEELTPWEAAKKFKACTFYVFFAALAAGTDGYQIGSASTQTPSMAFRIKLWGVTALTCGNITD